MIKRKWVGLLALFPPETIILHRVSTEYLPFSVVLQNILCQAHSGAPQPTLNGTKKQKTQHNKKKNDDNQNYHRTKKEYFPGSHNIVLSL